MGNLEMIFPDGSGIEFSKNEITSVHYAPCDACYTMTAMHNLRSILKGREFDAIWLCKECYKVK